MNTLERAYTIGMHLLHGLSPLLAAGRGKVGRGMAGRRGAMERIQGWAARERDATRPLVWLHAPSVGEGLQARAVLEALRRRRPDVQVVYTYFSPSAEPFAARIGADLADYLPLDLPGPMGELLDALRPAAVAFVRTEIWPNLTREAADRGVPTLLLSATLPASSSRLSSPARALLRPAHARLTAVAAISPADAERFAALGVPAKRRIVTGDSRFDQVADRARAAREAATFGELADDSRPTLVAGSTWPADEDALLDTLARLRAAGTAAPRLVIAPHEPDAKHLQRLERSIARSGATFRRLDDPALGPAGDDTILVVDRVGILGDLYAVADLAYVGGGFGTAGLHSVLEPAAYGIPTLVGPRHEGSREAMELLARGGVRTVTDAAGLTREIASLTADANERAAAGAAARRYVEEGLGAADRAVDLLLGIMGISGSPPLPR